MCYQQPFKFLGNLANELVMQYKQAHAARVKCAMEEFYYKCLRRLLRYCCDVQTKFELARRLTSTIDSRC